MTTILLLALLAAPPQAAQKGETKAAIRRVTQSARVLRIGVRSSERLKPAARLAPGAPPLLVFRYLDGKRRHRFGDLSLRMDDAGH